MSNIFEDLRLRMFGLPLPEATEVDRRHAAKLREQVAACAVETSEDPTESELCWQHFNERLRELVAHEDPRGFLRWDVIRKSMFVGNAEYIGRELDFLRGHSDWDARWKPAIVESAVGRPRLYPKYLKSSGNLIHHAAHVARFEDATGMRAEEFGLVFEFGGGYGSMARLFAQLGFAGDYLIYDFPYFSALQRFYLRSIGLLVGDGCDAVATAGQAAGPGIWCVSDIAPVKSRLGTAEKTGKRLFLATWSFSEAPASARAPFLPLLGGFDCFLIGFAHTFGEIDNTRYFKDWVEAMPADYRWHWVTYEELPGNCYLFGCRT